MKIFIFLSASILLLSSCNREELAKSNHDRDSLSALVDQHQSDLSEFISSFNDVERNLDSVAIRQHIIKQNVDKQTENK